MASILKRLKLTKKKSAMANCKDKEDKKCPPDFPPPGYNPTVLNALLANALDLTAPASDALLKNRKNAWVQLAGHPGSFAPAGPHTIWKKRLTKENNETLAYKELMNDIVRDLVPKFYREVEYNEDYFIEMEDLLQHFHDPNIMDIKMGTRTFLESEVKNPVLRKDLYEKMIKLSPDEPTQEEHEQKAVTKLRYMQFREQGSSTSTLGFRIEAIRLSGSPPNTDLKKIKTKQEIMNKVSCFIDGHEEVRLDLVERLKEIKQKFEASHYFKNREIIGSSLLILYDKSGKCGIWMIDFAKTLEVEGVRLTHREPWVLGNHEDGFLVGIDNLIQIFSETDIEMFSPDAVSFDNLAQNLEDKNICEKNTNLQSDTHSRGDNNDSHIPSNEERMKALKDIVEKDIATSSLNITPCNEPSLDNNLQEMEKS